MLNNNENYQENYWNSRAKKDQQGKEIPGTGDFLVDEKDRNVVLTEDGVKKVAYLCSEKNNSSKGREKKAGKAC